MPTISLLVAVLALPAVGIAQQSTSPSAADKAPAATLSHWLRATAARGPTAFEVLWQPPISIAAAADAEKPGVESARGSFATDLLWVEVAGAQPKTWLQAGRLQLQRDHGQDHWRLAGTRPRVVFLPDPVLALHALAADVTEVAARSIAQSDGAAVERITLCLTPSQGDALEFAGVILAPNPMLKTLRSMVKAGRLRSDEVPTPVVDVCVDVDVATRLVRRLHLRTMVRAVDARELLVQEPRAPRALADAGNAPQDDDAVAAAPVEIPKQFENGLPVRDQRGMQVVWVEFVLRDHGKAPPVVLDDAQKALLGR